MSEYCVLSDSPAMVCVSPIANCIENITRFNTFSFYSTIQSIQIATPAAIPYNTHLHSVVADGWLDTTTLTVTFTQCVVVCGAFSYLFIYIYDTHAHTRHYGQNSHVTHFLTVMFCTQNRYISFFFKKQTKKQKQKYTHTRAVQDQ